MENRIEKSKCFSDWMHEGRSRQEARQICLQRERGTGLEQAAVEPSKKHGTEKGSHETEPEE